MNYFEYRNNFDDIKNIKSKLINGKTKKDNPVITIAIPTYRRPDLLKETIDSALNQKDFYDYEVIVVDNDDSINFETQKLIESYNDDRILYYRNEKNLGMTGNWNKCIELSRGEWITILHDDDMLYPNFLKEMFFAIDNMKNNIDLLVCRLESGKKITYLKSSINEYVTRIPIEKCIIGSISPFPGIIFKKKEAIALGGFNNEFYPCADYVFWTSFCEKFASYNLNKVLAFYRVGDSSTTSNVFDNIIDSSYKIKCEIAKLSDKSKFTKKTLIKLGMKNLIDNYSNYTTNKSLYYKKYNIIFSYYYKCIYKCICYIKRW